MKRTPLLRRTPLRSLTALRKVNRKRKARLQEQQFGAYADTIRALPCSVCDRSPVEPHHVKSRGAGGDRSSLVPLCAACHRLGHLMGWQSFGARFRVDLAGEAAALWATHGDGA